MACETVLKPRQTAVQRKDEVEKRLTVIDKLIAAGRVGVKVGPQGAVTLTGLADADRDGLTDVCVYRALMKSGSAKAKMAILKAEQLAGRSVSRSALAAGIHSHDGGATWGSGH